MRRWRFVTISAAVLAATGAATAMFVVYPEAPVARLLANVTRELAKSPEDPHLLYLAGRTHAIAYAQGEKADAHAESRTNDVEQLPVFGARDYDRLAFQGDADAARLGHLREGIRLLRRAAELAKPPAKDTERDDRPLVNLGLAWLLDDGSRFAPHLGHPASPTPKDALTDDERRRIGVWRDANGNGVSDPGEVVPAAQFAVQWIAVRATRAEDGVPAADLGIGLADGSTRPTYDWTPRSLPEPAPRE